MAAMMQLQPSLMDDEFMPKTIAPDDGKTTH